MGRHASAHRATPANETSPRGQGTKRRGLLFHSLVYASLLLGSGDGLDDVGELGLERGAADEEAVDVGAGRQGRGVGGVGRATVLRESRGASVRSSKRPGQTEERMHDKDKAISSKR